MQIIKLYEMLDEEILAGKPLGRVALARLIENVEPVRTQEPIFLDFSGIALATSSFFREAILGFRDYCVGQEINLVPVLANPNRSSIDEFLVVLETKGDAVVVCELENDVPRNARVIGVLEEKQAITLEAVLQAKETDAVTLEKRFREKEGIRTTSWNNRLVSLAAKGLLLERKEGRTKIYRPVLELTYGY